MKEIALNAKIVSRTLRVTTPKLRNKALVLIADNLLANTDEILRENIKDVERAERDNLSSAMIDRLKLTTSRIESIAKAVKSIAKQPEVLGVVLDKKKRPSGIVVKKETIPLGVIAMIFESRPNVVIDAASLAIKSGNALILKGGKEASHSNKILNEIVQDSLNAAGLDPLSVQQVHSREAVSELLKLNNCIDVVIPRGGEDLVNYVYQNATMPVIAHFKGLCHTYIHRDADLKHAKEIIINAKTQRPGVCNATECLLLHEDLPGEFKRELITSLLDLDVEIRGCHSIASYDPRIKTAINEDYATEYLDLILSAKEVNSVQEAIDHINTYGSHHTEAILAKDTEAIQQFKQSIDCSCIVVNASTRFNDGGELGLGAELGISTSKFHAYGPMGAMELTTSRFVVEGHGEIRS